jgi:hypothetical protein
VKKKKTVMKTAKVNQGRQEWMPKNSPPFVLTSFLPKYRQTFLPTSQFLTPQLHSTEAMHVAFSEWLSCGTLARLALPCLFSSLVQWARFKTTKKNLNIKIQAKLFRRFLFP